MVTDDGNIHFEAILLIPSFHIYKWRLETIFSNESSLFWKILMVMINW